MIAYPIDFVRQILEQTLLEQSIDHEQYIGGSDQVSIKSFYEQVQTQEQVDRFVETFRDLTDQANRTGLIANGIVSLTENPTITNVRTSLVIPMNWNCMIRCTLEDRDIVVDSVNNMISKLKGRKVDIAEFSDGELFKVETVGSTGTGAPKLLVRSYIGEIDTDNNVSDQVQLKIADYLSKGIGYAGSPTKKYFYARDEYGKMMTIIYDTSEGKYKVATQDSELPSAYTNDMIWCPTGKTFEKYKVSISFDSIRVDEPKTLNGTEFMYISFGGSATLTNLSTKLGNDLQVVKFTKTKVITSSGDISLSSSYYLDPLELPNANDISSTINHIASNGFVPNTHANTITPSVQYTFLIDEDEGLLKQLFEYSRYGIVSPSNNGISPNMIFTIDEYWCSWGNVDKYTFLAKITNSVAVENTESDVMTIQLSLEIQGANN